jgi:hypothetical protein
MPTTARLAALLRDQARSCAVMGSPLYAHLLEQAATDAEDRGPVHDLLAPALGEGRSDALALRFMAAVHRLVLTRRAPALALHYPSVGGRAGQDGAWQAFRQVLVDHADGLRTLLLRPCQTNEVGRCAGLSWGLLELAARTGLPLRLREVGASAGLNLRWDRYRYGGGGATWGPAGSPVTLEGLWAEAPDHLPAAVTVADRRGCDPAPVDPVSDEGRLTLTAAVWADQLDRSERLRGALAVAAQTPASVDAASADTWLPGELAEAAPGTVTVVYHSVVREYLPPAARSGFEATLAAAGRRATADAPLAWLRMEPVSAVRAHGVTLTVWDGGEPRECLLAVCGAHGQAVRRPARRDDEAATLMA